MNTTPAAYIAIPTELTAQVSESKHTKLVYDRFKSWSYDPAGDVRGAMEPTESEALAVVKEDLRAFIDHICLVNGGGLERKDFRARIWVERATGGRFYASRSAGRCISFD